MKKILFFILFLSPFLGFSQPASERFDDKIAFIEYLKTLPSDFEKYTIEHMYFTENSLYNSSSNDEFVLQERVEEHQAKLKKLLEEKSNSLFHVNTNAQFGKYDFEQKAFNFSPLKANTYFNIKKSAGRYSCKLCETQTIINLFFNNTSDFKYMPMDKDSAKALLDARKNNSGYIDRDVQIKIIFEISESKKVDKKNNYIEVNLYGDIKEIEVVDSTRLGGGTKKTLVRLIPE